MRFMLACLAASALGCGDDGGNQPPPREVMLEAVVGADGVSAEVPFEIPEGTRSVTIVVEGASDALYALGAFSMGDGADLVHLPAGPPGPAMQMTYEQEQIGQLAGDLYQSIRLGTFTHVYPYRPGQVVVEGNASLRVASNRPGPVKIRILMPEDDGANALSLNIYVISDTLADPDTPAFRSEVTRLLAQANVNVTFNHVERITGTALERITDFSEPQEAPASMSAMLPGLVADRATTGLDVFFVEALPTGVGGLALGTPGPPIRGSYYFGVVVRGGLPAVELARITAHETGHFLGLQHVQNRGISGRIYPDPLDDTTPGVDNLMEGGSLLTPHQAFVLSRSALLEVMP